MTECRPQNHLFVSGFGMFGDALTCTHCGLSLYDDMNRYGEHQIVREGHPKYDELFEKAQSARAQREPLFKQTPTEIVRNCDHIMVSDLGVNRDTYICARCGFAVKEQDPKDSFLDMARAQDNVVGPSHYQYETLATLARQARAKVDSRKDPRLPEARLPEEPEPEPCQHDHVEKPGLARYCLHRCRAVFKDWGFWIGVTVSFPIEHFLWEHVWPFRLLTNLMGL
jgi:hypothetical protein